MSLEICGSGDAARIDTASAGELVREGVEGREGEEQLEEEMGEGGREYGEIMSKNGREPGFSIATTCENVTGYLVFVVVTEGSGVPKLEGLTPL